MWGGVVLGLVKHCRPSLMVTLVTLVMMVIVVMLVMMVMQVRPVRQIILVTGWKFCGPTPCIYTYNFLPSDVV